MEEALGIRRIALRHARRRRTTLRVGVAALILQEQLLIHTPERVARDQKPIEAVDLRTRDVLVHKRICKRVHRLRHLLLVIEQRVFRKRRTDEAHGVRAQLQMMPLRECVQDDPPHLERHAHASVRLRMRITHAAARRTRRASRCVARCLCNVSQPHQLRRVNAATPCFTPHSAWALLAVRGGCATDASRTSIY